mgnify:CR=1 FL=1
MPVDIKNLSVCIEESTRFLSRARAALQAHKDEVALYNGDGSKNAAVRRSSLDLTKALAQLRKY